MKNLSLALNIVLTIAVAYLYYLNFSGKKSTESQVSAAESTTSTIPIQPKEIKASKIVYVNADSLYEKYEYVKELKRETESKQGRLENAYKEKAQKLQQDYGELQQKASSGALSSDQAKDAEADLMKRKAELDVMERQLGELSNETQRKNIALQDKVNKFLREYNKGGSYNYILAYTSAGGNVLLASDSLDITHEILGGLNAQYKAEKKGN